MFVIQLGGSALIELQRLDVVFKRVLLSKFLHCAPLL